MPTQVVIEKLRQLHGQLAKAPAIPEVDSLKQHVATVLDEPSHRPHYGPLRERMSRALARLEAQYPDITAVLQSVENELIAAGL